MKYILIPTFTIVFVGLGLVERKSWLLVDCIISGLLGTTLLINPRYNIQNEMVLGMEVDAVHVLVARISGCIFIGLLPMWIWGRHSKDEKVVGGLLWSGFLIRLSQMGVISYGLMHYSIFSEFYVQFSPYGCFLLWLPNAIQLGRTRPKMGIRDQATGSGWTSTVFQIWFAIDFVSSILLMLTPETYLSCLFAHPTPFDGCHLHFTRMIGCLLSGCLALTWFAPSYQSMSDKKLLLICGILINTFSNVAILLDFVEGGLYPTVEKMTTVQLMILSWNSLFLIGIYSIKKEKSI